MRKNVVSENGDMVKVFLTTVAVHIPAKVTPRILPRVVALGEGAWYTQMVRDRPCRLYQRADHSAPESPLAKGNPQHTNLVQIKALKESFKVGWNETIRLLH
ncbi:hypothetical protein O9992_01755 [Vibrio lentus]|nr:hypothetical protein [Vibrio lentus]